MNQGLFENAVRVIEARLEMPTMLLVATDTTPSKLLRVTFMGTARVPAW
ncbi:MAG: hypothetical protein ACRERX_17915 [Pseudomonas sp.]